MEVKDPAENRLLSLYLPHKRLCKVDKWYQQMYVYQDLSEYKFNQEEKDFLCECIYSGDKSVIGTTSKFGKHRLTMAGVEERYKIKGSTVLSWLNNYRKSQIQSAMDIVNGIDSPVQSIVNSGGNKSLKRKAAADNDILVYPVKVEKIDIN